MAIFGGIISEKEDPNNVVLNVIHIGLVAPWLYYISTAPADWQNYLKMTVIGVVLYHSYRIYNKTYNKQALTKPGGETTMPLTY